MGTITESNLPHRAARHARRLQWIMAAAAVALTWFAQFAIRIAESINSLGFSGSDIAPVPLVGLGGLISIFASWSSVWIILGCGRWWLRLATALGIFHGVIALGLALAAVMGESDFDDIEYRDYIALLSASSYAFSAQILACGFFVWVLKACRFRLLYFDDAAAYPHPREAHRDANITDRPGAIVLYGRTSIADIFALTTWAAIYLAAWYPIEHALRDQRMFGASFVLMIVLVLYGFNAAVALPVVLLPGLLAMLDRRGKAFQIVCHSILFAVACATLVVLIEMQLIEDSEGVALTIAAVIAFLAYEGLLYFVMRRPTKWFRFRLVRATK